MKNSSTLEIAIYVHTYFQIAELQNGQKRCIWAGGHLHKFRSSRSQMFFKIYVLKTFANFIAKDLCWSQNTSKGCFCNSQFGIFFFHVARIDGRGIMISAFSFFLFSFANSIYLKKKNEKKNKLLRFDGIDLSHRKSKISKEFT